MPQQNEWQREVQDAGRREQWSLSAPNRLVKAVAMERGTKQTVTGYVTLEKFLVGRTPRDLEDDLGLPAGAFRQGCRIYRLTRLPMAHEIEYELTAEYPDGLAFDENAALDETLRRQIDPTHLSRPIYGRGKSSIHQWQLTAELPVALVAVLPPNFQYPYPHT